MIKPIEIEIDLSLITNDTIKKAITAIQAHNKEEWYACFTDRPKFINQIDGRDFKTFWDDIIYYNGIFYKFDQVRDGGTYIFANFRAGKIGNFNIEMVSHLDNNGRIDQMRITQMGITLNETWWP